MRFLLTALLFAVSLTVSAQTAPQLSLAANAWLLIDHQTGQVLTAHNPDERIEPASLTKLMTAYVTFSALRAGTITLDQEVAVSETAWRMTGSRMFIEPGRPVTVEQLINGMIVQSGNDACVALAELIAGSEEAFTHLMNREAQRLGMRNTNFANSSGLPDEQLYTTATDLALLASALVRDFPEYYPLYSQKEYTYNDITQPNRNRLLWLDSTVDGMKTGYTRAAGYCLVSTALRGPRRLISVVLGAESETVRAQESLKLLNYGFQFFDTVRLYGAEQEMSRVQVWKGIVNDVPVGFLDDFVMSLPKDGAQRVEAALASHQPVMAPIQRGQELGTLTLSVDGRLLGEYPVVALQDVEVAGFFGRLWDALRLWIKSL
ncbi:D-alanyl-D-alanine carboxypeptidase family protein [Azoarcus taiwanensis]|uniref:serine-type D-Ala-D-Ala carboxypeptidase n=1 Tax=Azoarcus taiwanensis TaxID=666964 RepID=A0A972F5L6_9RHOO|nr:D-alanyl-D-alanine carboxypeptidase family protein [Azoarcus taiwanensis]NMG01766.1 D-alanyl-D-alanine carboxypeptidase [Azoarcus taiwanensis]